MAVAGSLTYSTEIDKNGFEKGLDQLKATTIAVGNAMYDAFKKVVEIAEKAITNGIKYNGTIEQLQTSFEVMTGSADKAREIIEKLRKVGAETPYELEGLASTVQLLMQYGMTADQAYESTLQLGDISQGSATKMQGIALALGQMSSYGKVTLQDIKQMIGNGFNPLQEISRTTGESMTSLYDRISDGTLTVEEVTKAFKTASSEGGSYFQSMEKQSKTLNGQLSTLSDNFNELTGSAMQEISRLLVDTILPKTNEILADITGNMPTIIDQFTNLIQKVIDIIPYLESIGIIFAGWKIGTTIQKAVIGFQEAQVALALFKLQSEGASIAQGLFNGTLTLGETLVGLFTGKVTLAQLATAGLSKAQAVLNAVMSANPVALVVIAIAALIAIFVVLWNKCDWFRNFWIDLWEKVKSVVSTAIDFVVKWFNKIVEFVKGNWQDILLMLVNPFVGGFKLLYNNCESFRNFIDNLLEAIKQAFINAWNSIVIFFTETIPQWIQNVIDWFANLPYMIGYHIGLILGNIIQFGLNVWNWITVDLPQIIQSIIDWFAQLPGRIWEWLCNAVNNIIQWGIDTYNTATNWISRTINSIVEWFKQLPGKIWTWLTDVINKVVSWGTNMANKGKEAAINLFNNIVNTITGLPDRMLNIGKNIVEGLWNGITGMGSWIKNKINEFGQGLLAGMKESLGIHSPSTKARDLVGKFIPSGIAVGIEANTDEALRAIDNMNDDIMSEMNRAVTFETGSINAKASVKSNNSMLNVIQATFNIDGSVDIDGKKAGRIMTPYMSKTLRTGGAN